MITFYKYHGAGNDFILFNDFERNELSFSSEQIQLMCRRRFSIGADGIMILRNHPDLDFEVLYFNSDGSGGTLCGNGGRCMVAFASKLGIIGERTEFMASDGIHKAEIHDNGLISLQMNDVKNIERFHDDHTCYTGSPHYIKYLDSLQGLNVVYEGRKIRNSKAFADEGINVNFIQVKDMYNLNIRTYERGVEDETLACGTGSVAAALVHAEMNGLHSGKIALHAPGGSLHVSFDKLNGTYTNIWLTGPAEFVFEGQVNPG